MFSFAHFPTFLVRHRFQNSRPVAKIGDWLSLLFLEVVIFRNLIINVVFSNIYTRDFQIEILPPVFFYYFPRNMPMINNNTLCSGYDRETREIKWQGDQKKTSSIFTTAFYNTSGTNQADGWPSFLPNPIPDCRSKLVKYMYIRNRMISQHYVETKLIKILKSLF